MKNSFIENVFYSGTNQRFWNEFKTASFTTNIEENRNPYVLDSDYQNEYRFKLEYNSIFRCNSKDLNFMLDKAKKRLIHAVYKDFLELAMELEIAVYEGKQVDAKRLIGELKGLVTEYL